MTGQDEDLDTVFSLRRWHQGDRSSLDQLLQRDLPWIRDYVQRRLGPKLQRKADAEDYLQDVLVEALRYTPKFMVQSRKQFRALLGRIAENIMCNHLDYFAARRRDMDRESPLPRDSVLNLQVTASSGDRPSQIAMKKEENAWLRLALELMEPEDRRIILLRDWDALSFKRIGTELGISGDAARMRHGRAMEMLVMEIGELEGSGTIGTVVGS